MSKRDLYIICAIAVLFGGIGWGLKSCTVKPPVEKTFDNSAYLRREDSLNMIIKGNNDSILVFKQYLRHTDSLSKINFKNLSDAKKQFKNFTTASRIRYIDSLFKGTGK